MEENNTNLNSLEAEKARKMELLNEMNKLKFNNVNSEQITNDMFNSISSDQQKEQNIEEQTSTFNSNKVVNNVENQIENRVNDVKEEAKEVESKIVNNIKEEKSNVAEPPKKSNENKGISYFDGSMLDLMGWNFLRIVITIFTFGIGATWGECFYLKYKLSHTVLNGKRLKFEGEGSEMFVEQFKWTFLTIITFGIYGLWVPIKKIKWVVSKISFESDEFNKTKTFFYGTMLRLLGINILCALITGISLGLLYPVAECIKLRWLAKNTVINETGIKFEGKALKLYGKYILWIFLTVITLGIYGFWVPIKKIDWEVENTELLK